MKYLSPALLTLTALFLATATHNLIAPASADELGVAQTPEEILQTTEAEFFGRTIDSRLGLGCTDGTHSNQSLSDLFAHDAPDKSVRKFWTDYFERAKQTLIQRLSSTLPNWSTSEVVTKASLTSLFTLDTSKANFSFYCASRGGNDSTTLLPNTVKFVLTPSGQALIQLSIPTGAGVEPSILALGNALKTVKLVPAQRKVLKSFFDAAKRFYDSLQENTARVAKGERPRAVTHRDFMAQASLLIAYHRFLKDTLEEAAQLSSDYYGVDKINVAAVKSIAVSVQNLVEAYGLESDITQRQVADYGRVLSDLLLTQLSPLVSNSNKQDLVRPVIIQLAKMIAISEANGDTLVQDETLRFKLLWENREFATLMGDLLTTTDLKLNGLILNVNSLAYKIGLATNIAINVLDKEDIDQLRNKAPRK